MKSVTAWVVYNPDGTPRLWTVMHSRSTAIAVFREEQLNQRSWRDYYRRGYRCAQIDLVPKVRQK